MARLAIKGLQKNYGAVPALRGIDLEIAQGEFTVFVGPSGCGKSTLLRAIAGLEDVNSGTIEIDGEIVNDMRPRDRNIAMVFQNYALYPYMSVFENIAFGLRARKVPDSAIAERVQRAAAMLGIVDYLDRLPRQLSGGQRQRVAIGRAIVRDAQLFLFDEPLSNLDAQLREEMRSEIKRLHRDIAQTMIYVTHDQVEAMTLADRIVLLKEGKIEQIGSPLDLFERPATRFVAGFLGSPSINFVPASVVRDEQNDEWDIRFDGGVRLRMPSARQQALAAYRDRSITVGIRPEHMRHDNTGNGDLNVTFDLIQPTGARSYGTFTLGNTAVVAELKAHDVERAGGQTTLAVDTQRIILIDPQTDNVITSS